MGNLTYANVMATLAVFLVLGGGAYAATKITGKKIKSGALGTRVLRDGAVSNSKLKSAAVDSRVLGAINVRHEDVMLNALGDAATQAAPCAAGEKLLGGGADITDDAGIADYSEVLESAPAGSAWFAKGYSAAGADRTMRVYAICLGP